MPTMTLETGPVRTRSTQSILRCRLRRFAVCCALLWLGGACSGGITSTETEAAGDGLGRLGFGLIIDKGIALAEVRYTVTNEAEHYLYTAEVSYSDPMNEDFALFLALPDARDYTLAVEAELVNGAICTGETGFDIETGRRTDVNVGIHCPRANNLGQAQIAGHVNSCPSVDSVAALPSIATSEDVIVLQASGSDPDQGPQPLSYSWNSVTGVLGDSNTPTATFVCSEPGAVAIELTISDGHPECNADLTVMVECVEAAPSPPK
jgi:hypothetical protein